MSSFKIVSEELGQAKARALALEVENHELNCILERKGNLKAELISQLEQYELELKDMKGILCELQESCENKKEEINSLQEQLQAKQYVYCVFMHVCMYIYYVSTPRKCIEST